MDNNTLNLNALLSFLCMINQQVFNFIQPSTPTTTSELNQRESFTSQAGNLMEYQHVDVSNQANSSNAENVQDLTTVSNRKRKKKSSKGSPKKRLRRMSVNRENETPNDGDTEARRCEMPKKTKKPLRSNIDLDFDVETTINNRYEDQVLDYATRKLNYELNRLIKSPQTPKRPSKFMNERKKRFYSQCLK